MSTRIIVGLIGVGLGACMESTTTTAAALVTNDAPTPPDVTAEAALDGAPLADARPLADALLADAALDDALLVDAAAPPPPPPTFTELAAGRWHSVGRKSDGGAWAWGYNVFGQVGDNTNTDRLVPVRVQKAVGGDLTTIDHVCAGESHSVAYQSGDFRLWSWGRNLYGEVGDGTVLTRKGAIRVLAAAGVEFNAGPQIACGGHHSMNVKLDGTVWTWGNNEKGQLGNGTLDNKSFPVRVVGLANVIAVAGGEQYSLALKSDGTVWGWGYNGLGQLGNGAAGVIPVKNPVQVVVAGGGALNNVVAIAASSCHSLALKSDGTVWAWGCNTSGQLGDGTTTNRNNPVQVKLGGAGFNNVVEIAAGREYSLARRMGNTVWAWGSNFGAQLGDGTTTERTSPTQVTGGGAFTASGLGRGSMAQHSLAVTANASGGSSWGTNAEGELGDNSTTMRKTPVDIR